MTDTTWEVKQHSTLHYKGDTTDFDPDFILGPDIDDCYYTFTDGVYDPETDLTTMTLTPLNTERMKELMMKTMGQGLVTPLGTIGS
jgi:hypothetical protein